MQKPFISIIIPTFNEGAVLAPLLQALQKARHIGGEIILSDGGSTDQTCVLALPWVDHLITGSSGRAIQMNRAAASAQGDWLWFLHADSHLVTSVQHFITYLQDSSADWGHCHLRLDADQLIFRLIGYLMHQRSRFSQIATGDQGIFVRRVLFDQLGGYPMIPLMEDIALSKSLKRESRPACGPMHLLTSARRWQQHGILRTILLMWSLRLAYFFGVSPIRLATWYQPCNSLTHSC
jgi:rSAM/selenodomain-associated transferase 2